MVQPWGRIDIWQKSRINYICESRSYKKLPILRQTTIQWKHPIFFGSAWFSTIQQTWIRISCNNLSPKSNELSSPLTALNQLLHWFLNLKPFTGERIPNSPLWPTAFNCQWDSKQWNIPLVPCLEKIGLKSTYLFIFSGALSYSASLTWKVKYLNT